LTASPGEERSTIVRAEVVGSMLRPFYLKQARAACDQETLAAHECKREEDRGHVDGHRGI
jgi:hypothetical protein